MSANTPVRLLHVEDDPIQQRLIAFNLRNLTDYTIEIVHAASEDEAIEQFSQGGVDIILLDYHLSQGNGLSVLERIRTLDPLVPVIAISGQALAETAADLVRAGADDFIYKRDLTNQVLTSSIRMVLARSMQIRSRITKEQLEQSRKIEDVFGEMCIELITGPCQILLARIKKFEEHARAGHLTLDQLRRLFDTAIHAHDQACLNKVESARELLRPVFLEIKERLFSNTPTTRP